MCFSPATLATLLHNCDDHSFNMMMSHTQSQHMFSCSASESGELVDVNPKIFPGSVIYSEMMPHPSKRPDRSEVANFNKEQNLKHVQTTEKDVLPSQQGTHYLSSSEYNQPVPLYTCTTSVTK